MQLLLFGMRALLRDCITQAYNFWSSKEFCPDYEGNTLSMYDSYIQLKGENMEEIIGKLKNLPDELDE